MENRKEIRKDLEYVIKTDVGGDPRHKELKQLETINARVLLEVVDTLDRIDSNSVQLGTTNNKTQRLVFWLTVGIFILGIVSLIVALKAK
jgi:hypothetical protein